MFAEMTELYYKNIPQNQLPDIYSRTILKNGSGKSRTTYTAYANYVFGHTFFADSNRFNQFCKAPSFEKLKNDAVMQYTLSFVNNYSKNYQPKIEAFANKKAELSREYVHEIMQQKSNKLLYPDANSTMRVTYGKVLSYEPQDAVHYNYFTTL